MSTDNNKMQVDIENLFKQNVNDLASIKELYKRLKEAEEKITQIKYVDSTLTKKLKKEYESLKKQILDENSQITLNNKIDNTKVELSEKIDNTKTEIIDNVAKYNNVVNLGKLGAVSETVNYDKTNKIYNMTDISNIIQSSIDSNYDTIIFPKGNYLIDNEITITKPLTLIGNGCNIYSSPSSSKVKRIFTLKSSDVSISNFNFYSELEYTNKSVNHADANCITSNVMAISIVGKDTNQNNVNVLNCYFNKLTYGVSIWQSKNSLLSNLKADECYFPIYTGHNVENISIRDCQLSAQTSTDVYGHTLYLSSGSKNVTVDNCTLKAIGTGHSNIIKTGSNDGGADNIVVNNCYIECSTQASLFYVDNDLTLNNCKIKTYSPKGYSRLLQLLDESNFKCYGCEIEIDSFERYTQNLKMPAGSILFENCKLTIKNSYNSYCTMGFISGVDDFVFKNCDINFDMDRGFNIFYQDFKSVSLINCNINSNKNITCGIYTASDIVAYTQTSSPVLKMYNTVIKNNDSDGMRGSAFFMNIVKDETTTPICELSNITLYKCSGTTGGNTGKLFMANAETQYLKNNVIDLNP